MRRFGLIAVTLVAGLTQATISSASAALTHTGSHYYSRTIPKPCFVHPSATYRFSVRAGIPFQFQVAWGGHKPKVTTTQAGPWSYVTVHGPRGCGRVSDIFRVTVVVR